MPLRARVHYSVYTGSQAGSTQLELDLEGHRILWFLRSFIAAESTALHHSTSAMTHHSLASDPSLQQWNTLNVVNHYSCTNESFHTHPFERFDWWGKNELQPYPQRLRACLLILYLNIRTRVHTRSIYNNDNNKGLTIVPMNKSE